MPQNPPDFESLIKALNAEGVRFVVIGGLAMILQGSDYATAVSDFAVDDEPENMDPIVRALAPLRPHPHHYAIESFVWDDRSIRGAVVSLVTDAGDVDLLRAVPGVDSFEGLFARADIRTVFGEEVRIESPQGPKSPHRAGSPGPTASIEGSPTRRRAEYQLENQ